ncbi:MAG: hypothetical protein JXM70_24690 [Pirellulales bacterium]|nr:hypothetical protein [Pirellulales bacterium]
MDKKKTSINDGNETTDVQEPIERFQFTLSSLLLLTTIVAFYLGVTKYLSHDNEDFLHSTLGGLSLALLCCYIAFFNTLRKNRTGRVFLKWFIMGMLVECSAIVLLSAVDLKIYPFWRAVMGIVASSVEFSIAQRLYLQTLFTGVVLSGIVFGVIGVIIDRLCLRRIVTSQSPKSQP